MATGEIIVVIQRAHGENQKMVFGINAAGSAMRSLIQTSAKSPQATENLLQDLGKNVINARVAEKKMVSHGLWGGLALASTIPLGLAAAHLIPVAAPLTGLFAAIGAKATLIPGIGFLGAKLGAIGGFGAAKTAIATTEAAKAVAAMHGASMAAAPSATAHAGVALGNWIGAVNAGNTAVQAGYGATALGVGTGITGGIANAVGLVFRGHRDALLKPVEDLAQSTAQKIAQEGGEALVPQAGKSNPFALLGLGAGVGGLGVATLSGGGGGDGKSDT